MLMILPSVGCLADHLLGLGLGTEKRAGQVHGDHLVPIRLGDFLIGPENADAGVVDGDVQPPKLLDDLADHGLDLGLPCDVARDERDCDAHRRISSAVFRAGLLVEIDNRHVGPGAGQRHGAAAADAHRAAGHQGLLAGQIEQGQVCHQHRLLGHSFALGLENRSPSMSWNVPYSVTKRPFRTGHHEVPGCRVDSGRPTSSIPSGWQ